MNRINVIYKKLGRHKVYGYANLGDNEIELDVRLKNKKHLEILVHECLHILFPELEEDEIVESEEDEFVSESEEDDVVSDTDKVVPKDIKTDITVRKTNEAVYITKKTLIMYLHDWFDKNENVYDLTDVVDFMCKSYELYKPSIMKNALDVLELNEKIYHLILEINSRYKSDDDRVSCGAEFANAYQKHFKN